MNGLNDLCGLMRRETAGRPSFSQSAAQRRPSDFNSPAAAAQLLWKFRFCLFPIYRQQHIKPCHPIPAGRGGFLARTKVPPRGGLGIDAAWDFKAVFWKADQKLPWINKAGPPESTNGIIQSVTPCCTLLWMPHSSITQQECRTGERWGPFVAPVRKPSVWGTFPSGIALWIHHEGFKQQSNRDL